MEMLPLLNQKRKIHLREERIANPIVRTRIKFQLPGTRSRRTVHWSRLFAVLSNHVMQRGWNTTVALDERTLSSMRSLRILP